MGRRKTLSIPERKKMVRDGEVELTPRKKALLWMQAEPEHLTGPALSAARKGVGLQLSAEAAGLTMAELKYMLELGEDGHPAYREFRDEFLRARSEPAINVIHGVIEDATNEERRDLKAQRMALEIVAPGLLGDGGQKKSDENQMQTHNFTVNINEKFEAVPVVQAEDAEFEDA